MTELFMFEVYVKNVMEEVRRGPARIWGSDNYTRWSYTPIIMAIQLLCHLNKIMIMEYVKAAKVSIQVLSCNGVIGQTQWMVLFYLQLSKDVLPGLNCTVINLIIH